MANIENQKFFALDISGKNYLSWVLDVKLHLSVKKLRHTIEEDNSTSNEECAIALIFLRHHIDDDLKYEYLTVENPLELWQNLNDRFEHLKAVVLPKALNDCVGFLTIQSWF
ncbi:Med28 domain-containing protein [Cephalotus follicularis]|uniref:Med28 domain-containing protein n=1 Tax=Cephalotus follicularis TaxID=3775 RepID=A0A1Q3ARU1_CEPFO|nr:Med28 domain-containing protein [Cephalotus follicularis]